MICRMMCRQQAADLLFYCIENMICPLLSVNEEEAGNKPIGEKRKIYNFGGK